VTTGLLQKANDEQLRGILAHEIAHDDLGHVAKAHVLGTGLNLGVILLEQVIPGSSVITPIAGTLVACAYSRSEELEAAVVDSYQLILQPKIESRPCAN